MQRDPERVLQAYIACMLWAECDKDSEPLDKTYTKTDLTHTAIKQCKKDIAEFLPKIDGLIDELSDEQVGHDFWLTRNGHGSGFWDRDLGEAGKRVTEISKEIGECWVYVGDDGLLHLS